MTGNDDFLSRWSRRKRAAASPASPAEEAVPPSPASPPPLPSSGDAVAAHDAGAAEEPFDLASLPPLDSIVAGTDVSAFLKRGVPLDLTRAALRRAWSSDPAIRDFVGLAENAWDFNDPNAMLGFGPLDHSPEDVRRMLAQVMGEVRDSAEAVLSPPDAVTTTRAADDCIATTTTDDPDPVAMECSDAAHNRESDDTPALPPIDVATQQRESPATDDDRPRRVHGGALPR